MSVALWVGDTARTVGPGDFLHAFFSTVSYHLEPEGWGSRYPELMIRLYNGVLPVSAVAKVYNDVLEIQLNLKQINADRAVWDIEHPDDPGLLHMIVQEKRSDLSVFFTTSDGKDIISVLLESLRDALEYEETLCIAPASYVMYHPPQPAWLQSQRDITAGLPKGFVSQHSFINNRDVPYGTPGSIRPDNYRPGGFFTPPIVVDVKNYYLIDPAAHARLINETLKGIHQRAQHLHRTPQKIVIDLRGQHPDPQMLDDLVRRLVAGAHGIIRTDDVQFLR